MTDNIDEVTIKDANDLLTNWVEAGVDPKEQRGHIEALIADSELLALTAASYAGAQAGADRDQAIKDVFRIIGYFDKGDLALYRTDLAKAMGLAVREFNNLASAFSQNGASKVRPEDTEYTLGGVIEGWLVEYLYDPEANSASLAWRDPEGAIGSGEHVEIEGKRYRPKTPNNFIRYGGVIFPTEVGPVKNTRELVGLIEVFIREHYLLNPEFLYRIIAYYVLLTWIYDSFNALPYLRAIGEAGSGKSELMKRVGYICYRTMFASGANTPSTFFRATEMYRGTVFIDEADLHDGGDMANDIIKFLNTGAMRGGAIWRNTETIDDYGNKTFEPDLFSTYCPKLIAMRKDFKDDAVASRSITLKLMPREPIELKAAGVKLYVDQAFRDKALKLRNILLTWRLNHWEAEIEITEALMDLEISSRLNQVTMPLKALAMDDSALMSEIERFLRAFNMETVLSRSMTVAARVVEAIWKIYKDPENRARMVHEEAAGQEYIFIGDIRYIANQIMDIMNEGPDSDDDQEEAQDGQAPKIIYKRKKDELSARGVGAVIRNTLQLQVGPRRGKGYPVYWDLIKMEALAKRYGIEIPEYKQDPEQKRIDIPGFN